MSILSAETVTGKGRSASKGKPTPRAKDHHIAAYQANYRAKVQWYVVGAVLAVAIVAAIILLSIYAGDSTGAGHG